MASNLKIEGVTSKGRYDVIEGVRSAILSYGSLLNHQFYSGTIIIFHFEVLENKLDIFLQLIKAAGVEIINCATSGIKGKDNNDYLDSVLSVTFNNVTDDIIHEVPNVPG